MKTPLLVVCGPTASGKTKLGVELAKWFGGEIISADSMQIYRKMDIGTAKPTMNERKGIPHHLISFVDPNTEYSVAEYVEEAKVKIGEIISRAKLPILVGGTGLYIDSLCGNVQFPPAVKQEELRQDLLQLATEKGNGFLYENLQRIDPIVAEKIHPNDIKRVVRAIEIYELSKVPMSDHHARSKIEPSCFIPVKIGLFSDRQVLYERINHRVDEMLTAGLVKEVQDLLGEGLSKNSQSMKAIGYKEVFYYLHGLCTYDEMCNILKRNSRRYAKRQLTWFRRDKTIFWADISKNEDELYTSLKEYIKDSMKASNVL